ncbi:MAG TPA: alpha/beta family hydrolase [Candidatus Acidoferrum sp.]|nr:alpha/beta family hydrolase [Candidatus Acidoferrum sp.]
MRGSATEIRISAGDVMLDGELIIPNDARGLVLFAHGSGSSRHSPRNQFVAHTLQEAGLGTLLFDLLTKEEERADARTGHLRFDIQFLADRLLHAAEQMKYDAEAAHLRPCFFGSSTGGAAAIVAAAEIGDRVGAVVSRGGRPDLAGAALRKVKCPTLLIVGGEDTVVIGLNEQAMLDLRCKNDLRIVPGASHLFEEPGTLEQVAHHAAAWFNEHLGEHT